MAILGITGRLLVILNFATGSSVSPRGRPTSSGIVQSKTLMGRWRPSSPRACPSGVNDRVPSIIVTPCPLGAHAHAGELPGRIAFRGSRPVQLHYTVVVQSRVKGPRRPETGRR